MPVVAQYDGEGRTIWQSRFLHHKPAEVLGNPVWDLVTEPTDVVQAMGQCRLGMVPRPVEYRTARNSDEDYKIRTQFYPAAKGVAIIGIGTPIDTRIDRLSQRERQVLSLIPTATSREISQQLGISQSTVETHRARISRKLGLSGPELIAFAIENC